MGGNKIRVDDVDHGANTLPGEAWKLGGLIVVASLILSLSACEDLSLLNAIRFNKQGYAQGPAGGFIFYVGNDFALETAPYGWYDGGDDPKASWDSSETVLIGTGATSTEIGAGQENSNKIIEVIGAEGNDAAQLCANYSVSHNGVTYDNWFLPSEDELCEMYFMLHKQGVGGFKTDNYWSSTEISSSSADANPFGSAPYYQEYLGKNSEAFVRPVRRVRSFE